MRFCVVHIPYYILYFCDKSNVILLQVKGKMCVIIKKIMLFVTEYVKCRQKDSFKYENLIKVVCI